MLGKNWCWQESIVKIIWLFSETGVQRRLGAPCSNSWAPLEYPGSKIVVVLKLMGHRAEGRRAEIWSIYKEQERGWVSST